MLRVTKRVDGFGLADPPASPPSSGAGAMKRGKIDLPLGTSLWILATMVALWIHIGVPWWLALSILVVAWALNALEAWAR